MNIIKSKTINFNVIAGALVMVLQSMGIDIPVTALTGIFTLGNIILRFFTKKPLSEK